MEFTNKLSHKDLEEFLKNIRDRFEELLEGNTSKSLSQDHFAKSVITIMLCQVMKASRGNMSPFNHRLVELLK